MADGADRRIEVRLRAIEYGARNINLYRLTRVGGGNLPAVEPGAHIDLEIDTDVRRSYSLINSGHDLSDYVIGVLAVAEGRGGSKTWHRASVVGSTYWISEPRNNFALAESDAPSYLFAGGIGITPIIAMYRHLKARLAPAKLFYWVRTREDALFVNELSADANARIIVSGDVPKPDDLISAILKTVPSGAELYCCGPKGMLLDYDQGTALRPKPLVHSERFSGTVAETHADTFTVRLARQGVSLDVRPGQSILQACLDAGIDVSYSCEEGICGACEVSVLEGEVSHRDSFRPSDEHDALRTIMICSSVPKSGVLVLDI